MGVGSPSPALRARKIPFEMQSAKYFLPPPGESRAPFLRHSELLGAPRFTGESRCPRQKWIPAFAGKARRGRQLTHLNDSEQ